VVEQLAHDEPHLVLLVILIGRSSGTCRLSRSWWRRCCRRFFRPMNRRKRRARESGRALWASRGVVPTPVEVGLNRGGRNLIASRDDRLWAEELRTHGGSPKVTVQVTTGTCARA
jgi:hypothetical protein